MKVILSISGGGIRGLIPALLLEEIEKRTKKKIADCCDLIAGNSTGGLIACLLTVPNKYRIPKYTAEQIANMYKQFGKSIFKTNIIRMKLTLNGLIGNKYSYKPLEKLLNEYFGETRLNQVVTDIIIPAYQITNIPYPHFFKSTHAKTPKSSVQNPYLWECARSTSAASTFFAPYKYDKNLTFIDGGLFANNPAMCAYAEAKNMWGSNEQLVVISLGTGEDLKGYEYNTIKNWGMVQWAIPYFEQTSISADATVDYMLRTFSNNNSSDKYYRLQPELDEDSLEMDDASDENIARLENFAKQLIEKNPILIDQICEILSNAKS